MTRRSLLVVVSIATWGALLGAGGLATHAKQHGSAPPPPQPAPAPHGAHGTPPGWKPTWPTGDPMRGREVFIKLECYSCHEVSGESFPGSRDQVRAGPELSQMGPRHEPEYFVEAIVNPTATIESGKGYEAVDGSSKMPSFNDSMSVQELLDLVAYLRGLRPPAGAARPHGQR